MNLGSAISGVLSKACRSTVDVTFNVVTSSYGVVKSFEKIVTKCAQIFVNAVYIKESKAAPIFQYDDNRLYGAFATHAAWNFRKMINLSCSEKSLLIRFGGAVLAEALDQTLCPLVFLAGRVVQMAHYHLLSQEEREKPSLIKEGSGINPNTVLVAGFRSLSDLSTLPKKFNSTVPDGWVEERISLFAFARLVGADPKKCKVELPVLKDPEVELPQGRKQVTCFHDFDPREVACINPKACDLLEQNENLPFPNFQDPNFRAQLDDILFKNGYKAAFYDFDDQPILSVLDGSSVSIKSR